MKQDYLKLLFTTLIYILVFNFDLSAQWQTINTPNGGLIQNFIEKDNVIYVGTAENGLFYSLDNGIQWTKFNNSPGVNVKSLTVSGVWIFVITENGLSKSDNNGTSWQMCNVGSKNYDVKSQNGVIYLADDNGIFTSKDNGVTWTLNSDTRGAYVFSFSGSSLIATTWSANVFILNEQDKTWKSKYLPFDVQTSASAVYNNKIYVGTWGYGVYVSSNSGDSWQKLSSPLISDGLISQIAVVGNTIYVCSDCVGIFSSNNEGATWTNVTNGIDNLNFSTMHATVNKLFAGTYTGIYASTNNGSNWSLSDSGIKANSIISFAVNNGKYFLGTNHGLFSSIDNGHTWQVQASTTIYNPIKSIFVDGNNVLIGTTNGVIYSANNGVDWTKRGLNKGGYIIYNITKHKSNYILASNGGVFMSSNSGATWVRKTSGFPDINISLLVRNDTIYAGGISGTIYSGDNGSTWQAWTNLNNKTGYSEISILKSFNDILLANTSFNSNNLFVSYDKGLNWSKKEISPLALATSKDKLYVGTENGLLVSTNAVDFVKTDTLTTGRISVLENFNNVIYACVNSFNLWQNKTATGMNNVKMTKLLFYPNPADNELVIKNDESSIYNMRIIDLAGKVIINKSQYFNNTVNVSNLSNGIYVIEITDNFGIKSVNKLKIQHLK